MKERPILFSAPMVRAILDGTKTQTRRVVKGFALELLQPDNFTPEYVALPENDLSPVGLPGDRLWVRETFVHEPADYCWEASVSIPCRPAHTVYRADSDPTGKANGAGWTPSIHMPRALSRITLEITGVRVERLQSISDTDAIAEGVKPTSDGAFHIEEDRYRAPDPAECYARLWESINGAGTWAANPWVWVIEFKRVDAKDRS